MTELEKRIYNTHLAVSRSLRGKPFRKRSDFTDFENETNYRFVKKLSIFFTKYSDIDLNTYFIAPYKLYSDVQYFDLSYFASPRAVKSYSIFKQEIAHKQPDNCKKEVEDSLHYIAKFCLEHKIQLDNYAHFRVSSLEPEWVYHIKKSKINCYTLMEFLGIHDIITNLPQDEKSLFLGDFGSNFIDYKNKYNNSRVLKPFLTVAYNKIKFFVDKTLHKTYNNIQ